MSNPETLMLRLTTEQLAALRHAISRWADPAAARDPRYAPILQTLGDRLDRAEAMVEGLTGSRGLDGGGKVRIDTPAQRPVSTQSPHARDAPGVREDGTRAPTPRAGARGEQVAGARS